MKDKLLTLLGYTVGIILAIIVTPFAVAYYLIKFFWVIFGTSVIAFIILGLLGCSYQECLTYSGGLGFFIGCYLKYREISKKGE
jgi:hypothetical protein